MLLNIAILLILIAAFWRGMKKGALNELLNLAGVIISITAGLLYTAPITAFLKNWLLAWINGDQGQLPLVKLIVFIALFTLGWQVIRLIRRLLSPIVRLPVISQANSLAGGGINLVTHYLLIFVLLSFLILLPNQKLQQVYDQSVISQWIVRQTPVLSEKLTNFWISNSNEEGL